MRSAQFKQYLCAVSVIAVAFAATLASAQNFPSKPVRIVVPYPAGGPIDMTTRPLAQKLTEAMGNPVVVDNRGGANGMIGLELAARAPADGYTVVLVANSITVNPSLFSKVPITSSRTLSAHAKCRSELHA